MATNDDTLKALWLARNRDASSPVLDEQAVAAWLDGTLPEAEAERVEAALADSRSARELIADLRLRGLPSAETVPADLHDRLVATVLDRVRTRPARPSVLARIGMQTAAAAAAIAIAALGFIFGRVAAPATNEAATDFVAVVTFDVLADDDNMESVLLSTGLVTPSDLAAEGDQP
ncbi:MAG: zf-HC2 domain-containing protein [Phycisphaerales bacterium]|nr:zf-HC2 domain-containing protein [Phycisphaerales bacterium]